MSGLDGLGWPTEPIEDKIMNDTPTPRTDNNEYGWQFSEQYHYFDSLSNTPLPWADFAREIERELTTVTEQRNALQSVSEYVNRRNSELTEQRDRLAELLRFFRNRIIGIRGKNTDEFIMKIDEALQSLTTNEKCAGTDASGKTL